MKQFYSAQIIFLIRSAEHNAIPGVIDGVRTRVGESSRFHAGLDGLRPCRACSVPTPKRREAGDGAKRAIQKDEPVGPAVF